MVFDPLGLQLQILSCHVGAGTGTQVLLEEQSVLLNIF